MGGSSNERRLNPAAPEFFPRSRRIPNPTFPLPQLLSFRLPTLPPPHILRPRSRQLFGGGGRNPPPPPPPAQVMMESDKLYSRIVEHRDYHPRRKERRRKMPLNPGHSTVMICNIPNKYSRDMLMEFLDQHCIKENKKLLDNDGVISAYDFLYLPFDLSRKLNLGYAFVNFTHPGAIDKFKLACHNQIWEHCGSRKICELAAASMQGKEELMKHFENAGFACNEEEFLPVSFSPPGRGSGMPVSQTTVGILLRNKKPTSHLISLPN